MKLLLCFAALLVTQSLGFRVPFKTERDWSKIREKWANPDVSLPIRRTGDVAKNSMDINGRIVGGIEAEPHQYPWVVALFLTESDGLTYFCTATLIHPEWVLTAAHCAEGVLSFRILLGAHDVRQDNEDGRQEVIADGSSATVHPDWNSKTLANDIALIHLPKPVILNENISTIALAANDGNLYVNETVTLAGWGRTSDDATGISPTLQMGLSFVITNAVCSSYYSIITDGNICIDGGGAGSHAGSCNGDSGGPLMLPQKDGNFTQVGITSFGSSFGCELGFPDGYTRVSKYRQWISDTTNGAVPIE